MGGAAIGQHHVIGNVDQGRNRTLASAFKPVLQPGRAGAVLYAVDRAAIKRRAPFRIVGTDRYRAGEAAGNLLHRDWLQLAESESGEIAGDAVNAHAIGPVGGNRHVEHRIGAVIFGKGHADRGFDRQLYDPVVIVAQSQFGDRAHHPVRLDPADRALLELEPAIGHHRAGHAEHADHAGAGIGRAADHLERIARAGIDGEHLQLVSIGMLLGGQHLGHHKPAKLVRGVFNTLDFESDSVERGRDLFDRSLGFEVVLEPGQRELHARTPTPAERVGTSSGEKP